LKGLILAKFSLIWFSGFRGEDLDINNVHKNFIGLKMGNRTKVPLLPGQKLPDKNPPQIDNCNLENISSSIQSN